MKRLFAILPAAGLSRRMGVPKLTLPWGDRLVIDRVLDALDLPDITARVLVARADNIPLVNAVARHPTVILLQPDPPPAEMRHSVEAALREIADRFAPSAGDGWLLVPADHPLLDRHTIATLCEGWQTCDAPLLIPTSEGVTGHPVVFRWDLAAEVFQLPAGSGLNVISRRHAHESRQIPVANRGICEDLDTPADLVRLRPEFPPASPPDLPSPSP
ncbi:MAG: NTP transferase domain-containing protein [Planctomycetaceae bacterium]